jgi:tetratricopeptide (TPR) repeat protein
VCSQIARYCSLPALAVSCLFFCCLADSYADSLESGLTLYRSGDCPAAIRVLKDLASSNPAANLPLGECYLDTGSYEDAIEPLLASLRSFPSDTRALHALISAYTSLKRDDDAKNLAHSYLVQHPDSLDAKVQAGLLQIAGGDKESASLAFQAVLEKSPDFPSALYGLGLVASAGQQWPEAIQYLMKASQVAPGVPAIYSALGDAYARQGQCEQAVGPYKQAFDLMPSNFAAAKSLARCYARLGKQEDVARVLRSSTLQEARDTEATEMVAIALKSDPKALGEYLRDVIELNPENIIARKLHAETLESSHKMDEAEAEYLEILKLQKDNPDPATCFSLGAIEEAKNKFEDAHKYYELAARAPSATTAMHLALARVDLALKDAPDAQIELNKVKEPENQTPEFHLMQLEVLVGTAQFDSAAAIANDLLAQRPNDPKVLDLAAQVASKQHRYDDATTLLERLLVAAPDDKTVRSRLVRTYVSHPELKKDDRTLELLSNFVSRQEVDPEGYFLLALLYFRNKDLANAKTFFDLGFSHMPTPVPPNLAWAYSGYTSFLFSQGDFENALTSQLRAAELNPNDESTQYYLGLAYVKLGRAEEAAQVVGKLQAMNSDQAEKLQEELRKIPHKAKSTAQ